MLPPHGHRTAQNESAAALYTQGHPRRHPHHRFHRFAFFLSASMSFATYRLNGDRIAAAQPTCSSRTNSHFRHEATCFSTFCFSASDTSFKAYRSSSSIARWATASTIAAFGGHGEKSGDASPSLESPQTVAAIARKPAQIRSTAPGWTCGMTGRRQRPQRPGNADSERGISPTSARVMLETRLIERVLLGRSAECCRSHQQRRTGLRAALQLEQLSCEVDR